ncbi:MAG: 50S ribosomal protein L11 methyltransferase [Proteobacteria bacterium]|nr:50S ribosomal protein L11 methyltransferase [Pseudomonadota bacterium]
MRPSEYTAALIQVLRAEPDRVRGCSALEMGSGSGVVLAALGALGATPLCGIDIEGAAVDAGARLLGDLGQAATAEFLRGDKWQPVAGRRFDLIVANLPHFPLERPDLPGRLPTWSAGGADGRLLLDPFLAGLGGHLTPDGRAVITHNGFVGIGRSRELLAPQGLNLRLVDSTLVYIPAEKLERMAAAVLLAETDRTIHCYGPYAFGEMHIVEISRGGAVI